MLQLYMLTAQTLTACMYLKTTSWRSAHKANITTADTTKLDTTAWLTKVIVRA